MFAAPSYYDSLRWKVSEQRAQQNDHAVLLSPLEAESIHPHAALVLLNSPRHRERLECVHPLRTRSEKSPLIQQLCGVLHAPPDTKREESFFLPKKDSSDFPFLLHGQASKAVRVFFQNPAQAA